MGGSARSRREGFSQNFDTGDSFRLHSELFRFRDSNRDSSRADGQTTEQRNTQNCDGYRTPAHTFTELCPPASLRLVDSPKLGDKWPEKTPAKDHDRCRQDTQSSNHGHDDSTRAHQSQCTVPAELSKAQCQQRQCHGSSRRKNRWTGTLHSSGHRLVTVLNEKQLFLVAGDKEQGIVRSGTKDEDREDSRDRAIRRDVEERRHVASNLTSHAIGCSDDE